MTVSANRHIFMVVSLTLHAVLIALCYYFGSYQIDLIRQQDMLRVGAELSKQACMEKRVLDMKQINNLLEQSRRAYASSDAADDQAYFSATSLPKSPAELLDEARQLSVSITEVEKRFKVDELARIEGISKDQAREQLEAQAQPSAIPPVQTATPQPLATEIEQLEMRARASLFQRHQDLLQRLNGVAVTPPESSESATYGGGQQDQAIPSGASGERAKDGSVGFTPGRNEGATVDLIAKFINRDLALPKDVSQRYYRNGERIFSPGSGQIPVVHAATMHKGAGRMLGRGG